jgi:hypothetical protein
MQLNISLIIKKDRFCFWLKLTEKDVLAVTAVISEFEIFANGKTGLRIFL